MSNSQIPDSEFENEISLTDIIDFFKEGWKQILITIIATTAIGTAYIFLATPKYLATANIQTAKVANIDVEAPNVLIEKIKIPTYYSQKTFDACNLSDRQEPGASLAKALSPSLLKAAPIISLSYKSTSPEAAKKCLESVLEDISAHQNDIAKPLLEIKKGQLASLKEKLESADQISKALFAKKTNFDFNDTKSSASTLLVATILNKENETKELQTEVNTAEIALTEPQTRGTYLTTPIYSPNVAVEPKPVITLLISIMIGALLGVGFLLARKTWSKISSK